MLIFEPNFSNQICNFLRFLNFLYFLLTTESKSSPINLKFWFLFFSFSIKLNHNVSNAQPSDITCTGIPILLLILYLC